MEHSITNFRDPVTLLIIFWLGIVTPLSFFWAVIKPHIRLKPSGYIGTFRRPDGRIVHVARMPSGTLWATSDEPPGKESMVIGYLTGRELTTYHKLSSSPDGHCIARP